MPAYLCTRGTAAVHVQRRPDHFRLTDAWGRLWICAPATPEERRPGNFHAVLRELCGDDPDPRCEVRIDECRDRERLASLLSAGVAARN